MQNQPLTTLSTTKVLNQVLLKDCKIKVQLDKEISDKIKFLCRQISDVEWSGVLFYSVEGSITDPKNMVINLKDILPMHKGSGTYTEYDYTERLIEFRMDNPATNYFKIAHIHSHNTMGTFFSGTDISELHDNSKFHNYYLSVIVNNVFSITARIAFRGYIQSTNIQGVNEDGIVYTLSSSEKEEVMFYYECDIITSEPIIEVSESFKNNVKFIIDEAAKPKPIAAITTGIVKESLINPHWGKDNHNLGWQPRIPYGESKRYEVEPNDDRYVFRNENLIDKLEDLEDTTDDDSRDNEIEDFLTNLLTSHPDYLAHDFEIIVLEDAFIYLRENMKNVDVKKYFDYIMDQFPELYASDLEPVEGEESFLDQDIETMIEMVEEFRTEYRHANIFLNRLLNFQKQIEHESNTAKVNPV